MNLYSIVIGFSDHRQGIGQHEAESALDALKFFIEKSESLKGFDRDQLLKAINTPAFIQLKHFKGFWLIRFDSRILLTIIGPNNDRILGGHVIQSDPNGPERET